MALSNALLLIFFAACHTSHAASCPQGWTHSPASQSGIAKCYRGAGPAIPNRGHALAGVYGKTHAMCVNDCAALATSSSLGAGRLFCPSSQAEFDVVSEGYRIIGHVGYEKNVGGSTSWSWPQCASNTFVPTFSETTEYNFGAGDCTASYSAEHSSLAATATISLHQFAPPQLFDIPCAEGQGLQDPWATLSCVCEADAPASSATACEDASFDAGGWLRLGLQPVVVRGESCADVLGAAQYLGTTGAAQMCRMTLSNLYSEAGVTQVTPPAGKTYVADVCALSCGAAGVGPASCGGNGAAITPLTVPDDVRVTTTAELRTRLAAITVAKCPFYWGPQGPVTQDTVYWTMRCATIETIYLASGTFTLGGTQLTILTQQAARLIGTGKLTTVLDAGGASRIFDVSYDGQLELHQLSLKNGNADYGGAVRARSSMPGGAMPGPTTMPIFQASRFLASHVRFEGNSATADGGAVYSTCDVVSMGLDTIIKDSDFISNTAPNGMGGSVVVFQVNLNVIRASFSSGSANDGGAMSLSSPMTTQVYSSTFSSVSATNTGGAIKVVGQGVSMLLMADIVLDGGTAAIAGGVYVDTATVQCTRCSIKNTQATTMGMAVGGAALTMANTGTLKLTDTNITNAQGTMMGGAIGLLGGHVELTRCRVVNTWAIMGGSIIAMSGGVSASVIDSFFSGTANTWMAAFFLTNGPSITITGSHFENFDNNDPTGGGGEGIVFGLYKAAVDVSHSTFENLGANGGKGILVSMTQASTFRLRSSTVVSRLPHQPTSTMQPSQRSLFGLVDAAWGVLSVLYSQAQLSAFAEAIIELDDVQITHKCFDAATAGGGPGTNPPLFWWDPLVPNGAINVFAFTKPHAFRNVQVSFENCDPTAHDAIWALPSHAVGSCSTGYTTSIADGNLKPICGPEATCTNHPMILDADNGGAASATATFSSPRCTCEAVPYQRYPVPPALASESTPALVPYEDGCVTPTQSKSVTEIASVLTVALRKTSTQVVPTIRTLTLEMVGTDSLASAPSWRVASMLPSWMTLVNISSSAVSASHAIALPEVVGIRLDRASTWIVAVTVELSPSSLPERPEPYTTGLTLAIDAQIDANRTMPTKVFVQADPVASTSVWGTISPDLSDCSHVVGLANTSAILLPLGDVLDVPFQSCDIEGLAVQHSVPTQDDARSFTAHLVEPGGGAQSVLGLQYSGSGAYLVKLAAQQLGWHALELTLDGLLVASSLAVESVCPAETFHDTRTGTCKLCRELVNAPLCPMGVIAITLQTLTLDDGTWRPTMNSSKIFKCKRSRGCLGGPGNLTYEYKRMRRYTRNYGEEVLDFGFTDGYCAYGHTGALCSSCHPDFYMASSKQCMECGSMVPNLFAIVSSVLLLISLLIFMWVYRAQVRMFFLATLAMRRMITWARVKIVFATYQIIAAVMWGVPDVQWPEPFNSFAAVLEVLNFFVVGTSCISQSYNFYVQIILVTISPIVMALGIFAIQKLRISRIKYEERHYDHNDFDERRQKIKRQHLWLFMLLCYVVMPSTSISIFRLFLCHEGFGSQENEAYLRADYLLHCYTEDIDTGVKHYSASYVAMRSYAFLMILVYPIGINAMWLVLLYKNRATINPKHLPIEKAMQLRQSNQDVQYLTFIFQYYQPSCYLYEVVDSTRRLLLGGFFVFFSDDDALNCCMAFLIAFVYYMILRETQPFVEGPNNMLANVAQLAIMFTFFGGFLLDAKPFDFDPDSWGWLLFLGTISVVALAVWFQYRYGSAKLEMQLRLMEHEFRDAELALTLAETRNDIEALRAKELKARGVMSNMDAIRSGKNTRPPSARSDAEGGGGGGGGGGAKGEELQGGTSTANAAATAASSSRLMPWKTLTSATARSEMYDGAKAAASKLASSLLKPKSLLRHETRYPCYVISLTNLSKLKKIVPHEELLLSGQLEELTRTSRQPSGAFTFFISQNWEQVGSPDNAEGTKLAWLQRLRSHLSIPLDAEVWIWWDVISIPQLDRTLQLRAIASLPFYANICSRFVPLVRDPHEWLRLYGEDETLPNGTLAKYLKRGWCRLEVVAALCPKRFEGSGQWRPGPLNMRFRYHQSPDDPGVGEPLRAADLLDPREGEFNNEDDRTAMEPVLLNIALEFLLYERSGATSWDTCLDVRRRPQWLKALGVKAEHQGTAPRQTKTMDLQPTGSRRFVLGGGGGGGGSGGGGGGSPFSVGRRPSVEMAPARVMPRRRTREQMFGAKAGDGGGGAATAAGAVGAAVGAAAGVAAGLTSVVPGAAGGAEGGGVVDDAVEDFDPEDPDVEELLGELEQP